MQLNLTLYEQKEGESVLSRSNISLVAFTALVLVVAGRFVVGVSHADNYVLGTEVEYVSEGHGDIEYVVSQSGNTFRLFGLTHMPFRCDQPDSNSPIVAPCGPVPYSQPTALFAVLDTVDFRVEVLNRDLEVVALADFKSIVPGPYGVRFEGASFEPGGYWVQLRWSGRPVGKALYAYTGPK